MPKISVIVPLWNEEKFIGYTIKCLRAQKFKEFECIIVDDCSSDKSIECAQKAIDGDSRFHIVSCKINSKLPAARNIGLLYASGEFVIFLDADDLLSKTCLEERYATAQKYKGAHIAGCYSTHRGIPEHQKDCPESTKVSSPVISFQYTGGDNPFVVHSPLTRRSIACGVGGFDERLTLGAEDFDFWTRILRHGFIYIPTNTQNAFYREKANSMIRRDARPHLKYALKIYSNNNIKVKKNTFFSIAAIRLNEPAYQYVKEEKYANRILRFVGMQLVNNIEIDIKEISQYLPHFYQGFPTTLDAFELVRYGLQRSNVSLKKDQKELKTYDLAITNFLSQLITETRLNNSLNVEEESSNIYSAEWQRNIDIAFIPHKDYHTATVQLLQPYLEEKGLSFVVADCSAIYRDEGVRSVLAKADIPHVSLAQLCFGDFSPKAVVVFNDWDKAITYPAMLAAKKAGIVAMGIVEGVQDYNDADTGRVRNTYRTCDHVITPCAFDMKYFQGTKQKIYEGGIPRISKLATEAKCYPFSFDDPIVINSNFSYNVLTDKRDDWVKAAVDACNELNIKYTISQHPADKGDFSAYNVTSETMYDAIWHGSIFISRFGSGIIEAIAMNRPVIYFNPHGEKVDKFKNPMGAYYIANSKEELKKKILQTKENIETLRKHWPSFLALHAGYSAHVPDQAIQRVADALEDSLTTHPLPSQKERRKFGEYLAASFQRSDTVIFKNIKQL